ncbi:CBS domain-containing protein [Hathewaya histolytica]|uniref:Inosine-5'-monophosphate dehydrogenase n=1 Tax=Hathewaya histolytica TaxID=1498 RepID=A0A4U9R8J2_HATHI|nr:CBS domain-containing protein [Hathewaya histolytica]VTQ85010.1 inosine-5'-monophosphate dehydrogenase [Hathewaya histolytica]
MKVKDIMSREVVSLNADDTVGRAAELMRNHNIGSVPVCNEEKVIGIITDRDIAIRSVASGENFNNQKVRDVMSSNPVCGESVMSTDDAARIMSERQIRRLPIVDNSKLVGMVSLGDLAVEPKLQSEAGDALMEISESSSPEF